jgi:uncharacterized protein YkwD
MKKFIGIMCLLIVFISVDTVFARGGRGHWLFHRGGSQGGQTSASQSAPVDNSPTYEVEHRLLNAINAIREKYGLKALILDTQLHRTARQHCGWMANAHSMVHSTFPYAENIAMGQADVDGVMNSWMNSSGHRANILNPSYTKIGLSGYASPSGSPFWCQQFE